MIIVSLEHEWRKFDYNFNISFVPMRIQNSQLKEISAYNENEIPDQID